MDRSSVVTLSFGAAHTHALGRGCLRRIAESVAERARSPQITSLCERIFRSPDDAVSFQQVIAADAGVMLSAASDITKNNFFISAFTPWLFASLRRRRAHADTVVAAIRSNRSAYFRDRSLNCSRRSR